MNALFRAALDFEAFCAARGWRCCVIGGLAVQRTWKLEGGRIEDFQGMHEEYAGAVA